MTHPLYAGVARQDITPPLGTLLMGYADPDGQRKATSVRDPLNVTALALAGDQGKAVVMSLDVCIMADQAVASIRQGVEAVTGVPGRHVTISATHTHSAPRTMSIFGWSDLDTAYVEGIMIPRAIEAAAQAVASLAPVRLGIGETRSDAGVNRRAIHPTRHVADLRQNEWGSCDPTMTVLRFQGADGPVANVIHYGAHPTVLGRPSLAISRDWPGIMVDRVEQLTKATTLFLNNASGDVAPRTNSMGAVGDGTEAAMWEAGAAAGMDAMRAWRSIRDWRDAPLSLHVDACELPYRPLSSLEEAQTKMREFEPRKHEPGNPMAEYKHWQAVVEEHQRAPRSGKHHEQVITAIGPVAMVPMPGEPFCEISLRLRDASPYRHTLVLGTSNGHNGYFFTRESVHRGGYEVWVNRAMGAYLLAEGIDDALVERNLAMLKALHARS